MRQIKLVTRILIDYMCTLFVDEPHETQSFGFERAASGWQYGRIKNVAVPRL